MQRAVRAAAGLSLLVVTGLLFQGCASGPRILTNSDPSADWTSFRTFGFFQPLGTDRGSVRSITSTQLMDSVTREMQAAGFARADSNPDLLINFVVSTRETLQTRPSTSVNMHHSRGRYSTWNGWSAGMSTTEVVQRTEGTLAVDIVDRERNQLVWEGAATGRVSNNTRQNQEAVLDQAIADIFTKFP
jgi:hypothetical protein